jgi:hypothetical protein
MSMPNLLQNAIELRLRQAVVGNPIIGNTLRGLFVEAMIAEVLAPDWSWVGADWSSWDFEHDKRWDAVEVKQSAALQTWSDQYTHDAAPRFDIAERTGYWYQDEGSSVTKWWPEKGRPSDLYIFAWHGITDRVLADQREPMQWDFYISRAEDLPDQRSIGLNGVRRVCGDPCNVEDLKLVLDQAAHLLQPRRLRR